jgi:predicted  nucleic acid-binding Zn-ribbon protein
MRSRRESVAQRRSERGTPFLFLEERLSHLDTMWELQTVLNDLADREKQLTVKPESFAAVDREYHGASEEIAKLEQQLEVMNKERRRVEGELNDQQELLKKYQGQLMQVKNQQQYAAAWKEIDATRKHVKELEDSVVKSMEEIDGVQKQIDEKRAGYGDLEARYKSAYDQWQSSMSHLKAEAETLRGKAEEIEMMLPAAQRANFQRTLKQRQNIAVARVSNGDTCSACRSRIRPALFQQLKRGEVVNCEGCYRILYLERSSS